MPFERKFKPVDLSPENLKLMYHVWYRPQGSGPLGCMKVICSLIEEIAELKGIDLSASQEEIQKLREELKK